MKPEQKRIAIIGAGPIGLEAALAGRCLDLTVDVYEKGRIGEHLQQWGHVRLFTPFAMNSSKQGREAIRADFPDHAFPQENDCLTGRQYIAQYLDPLAKTRLVKGCIHLETQVVQIGRQRALKEDDDKRSAQSFRLLLREKGKERVAEADIILDCTGVYGQHRWLGDGGIPAPGEMAAEAQIRYGLEDILGDRKSYYAGKTVLVYGGGYSAATAVCQLAELAKASVETWVIWLARTSVTQPIRRIANDPLRERDRVAVQANTLATRGEGNVEFHPRSYVEAVESLGQDKGFKVHAILGNQPKVWDVERLIANVGYSPDRGLAKELQIDECPLSFAPARLAAALRSAAAKSDAQAMTFGPESLRTSEPNFFILGSKSYGRNSNFLLRNGLEQVREVYALIHGKKV
jgi:hypothetical protein